jgi:hypothetical protein
MISNTCHCGAVQIAIPGQPEWVIDCNCSICRRYGALWAQYKVGTVRVTGHPEHTVEYIWGEKTIRTLRCRHCGCVTHWDPLAMSDDAKLGVNVRNFEPEQIGAVPTRRFDGANTWTYLD